jgi:hypothetical protein
VNVGEVCACSVDGHDVKTRSLNESSTSEPVKLVVPVLPTSVVVVVPELPDGVEPQAASTSATVASATGTEPCRKNEFERDRDRRTARA